MIKITNKIDGKLYELVPAVCKCRGCAFHIERKDYLNNCGLTKYGHALYHGKNVCTRMDGIWKEVVSDENNK